MKRILGVVGLIVSVTIARGGDVSDLVKQLKTGDNGERRAAAKSLGEGGAESKEAVPALIRALKDRDTFVRRFAAQALGAIGPDASSAVPALTTALSDPKKEVQESAAQALGKIGSSGITTLVNLVRDDNRDPITRRQAVNVLSDLGTAAHSAVPALTNLLKVKPGKSNEKRPPNELRVAAASALGSLAASSDKEAIAALESLIDKKSKAPRDLRQAANQSLRKIRSNKK